MVSAPRSGGVRGAVRRALFVMCTYLTLGSGYFGHPLGFLEIVGDPTKLF